MRRRNRTTESLLVEAAFTAVHDLLARLTTACVWLAIHGWCYAVLAVGVVRGTAWLCWQQVHADDRAVLAGAARRLPALTASAAWACGAAASWLAASLVLWGWGVADAVLAEVERSRTPRRVPATAEYVELVAWEMDRLNASIRGQTADEEEDLDQLWIDTGNPVGRAAA